MQLGNVFVVVIVVVVVCMAHLQQFGCQPTCFLCLALIALLSTPLSTGRFFIEPIDLKNIY